MHYTIYRTVNKINGKVYIGKHQTKDLNDGYMGSGKNIQRALKKYGVENFNKEILFIYETEELMNAKEKELVTEEFCLREDTYNICVGGQGGFSYINRNKIGIIENASKGGKAKHKKFLSDPSFRKEVSYTNAIITPARLQQKKNNCLKNLANLNLLDLSRTTEAIEKRKETYRKINHSQGEKNSQFGSMWITNGIENKKIKKVEIIPEGWYKGRS